MADIVDVPTRSRMMAGIRGRDTKPELIVRSYLHARGYRFRLHRKDLPGRPDIVLPRYQAAIFVHGCFWHAHDGCRYFKLPASRPDFWTAKLMGNRARDLRDVKRLEELGWRVALVWECGLRNGAPVLVGLDEWLRTGTTGIELPDVPAFSDASPMPPTGGQGEPPTR